MARLAHASRRRPQRRDDRGAPGLGGGYAADRRYSPVGQTFHWVMAALVLFQLWVGMAHEPDSARRRQDRGLFAPTRRSDFMPVLAAMRALWRLVIPGPVNDADRLGWQTMAAYVTHILFYLCFFGLPLSG